MHIIVTVLTDHTIINHMLKNKSIDISDFRLIFRKELRIHGIQKSTCLVLTGAPLGDIFSSLSDSLLTFPPMLPVHWPLSRIANIGPSGWLFVLHDKRPAYSVREQAV